MAQYQNTGPLLGLALAAMGGMAPGLAAGGTQPVEVKLESGAIHRWVASYAFGKLSAGDGVRLQRTRFETQYDGTDYAGTRECGKSKGAPDTLEEGSRDFCYGVYSDDGPSFAHFDTGYSAHYDILARVGDDWKPSGYYVALAGKVPMIGDPAIFCEVRKSGANWAAKGAPFRCEESLTAHQGDPKGARDLNWKITPAPVKIIDATDSAKVDQAAALIGQYCKTLDTPQCQWTRTQKSSAMLLADESDWLPLTNWDDSCPPTDPTRLTVVTATHSAQLSWSDKVGGKISGKVGFDALGAKVEAAIEANYEHAITASDTFGEGHQYTIPYNYRAALYLQHGILEVTGDFAITTQADEHYLIKNASFRFPLQKDVKLADGLVVRRGVVQHVTLPCTQPPPTFGAPPPKGARTGPLAAE